MGRLANFLESLSQLNPLQTGFNAVADKVEQFTDNPLPDSNAKGLAVLDGIAEGVESIAGDTMVGRAAGSLRATDVKQIGATLDLFQGATVSGDKALETGLLSGRDLTPGDIATLEELSRKLEDSPETKEAMERFVRIAKLSVNEKTPEYYEAIGDIARAMKQDGWAVGDDSEAYNQSYHKKDGSRMADAIEKLRQTAEEKRQGATHKQQVGAVLEILNHGVEAGWTVEKTMAALKPISERNPQAATMLEELSHAAPQETLGSNASANQGIKITAFLMKQQAGTFEDRETETRVKTLEKALDTVSSKSTDDAAHARIAAGRKKAADAVDALLHETREKQEAVQKNEPEGKAKRATLEKLEERMHELQGFQAELSNAAVSGDPKQNLKEQEKQVNDISHGVSEIRLDILAEKDAEHKAGLQAIKDKAAANAAALKAATKTDAEALRMPEGAGNAKPKGVYDKLDELKKAPEFKNENWKISDLQRRIGDAEMEDIKNRPAGKLAVRSEATKALMAQADELYAQHEKLLALAGPEKRAMQGSNIRLADPAAGTPSVPMTAQAPSQNVTQR